MARAWCIGAWAAAVSLAGAASAHADAGLWIRSRPWPAPWSFSAEELAAALRLRLPAHAIRVTPVVAAAGVVEPVLEAVAGDPPRLRLVRGREILLDAALPAIGDEASRRAALYAAIALETAGEPEPATPRRAVAAEVGRAAPPPVAALRWSLGAAVGPALALDDDDAAGVAPALLLRLRVPLAAELSLEVGGKLSGAYGAAAGVDMSIVDRAVWLGASYRVGWSRVAVDLGLAAQYTSPSVDVDGVSDPVVSPRASRFGARASAALAYAVLPRLAVVAGAAATFAFADREFTAGGRELAELGAATLDLTVGPEVRW